MSSMLDRRHRWALTPTARRPPWGEVRLSSRCTSKLSVHVGTPRSGCSSISPTWEQPRLELGGEDRQPSVAGRTEPASLLRPAATISGIGADIREVTILEPDHELEIGGWIEEGRASSIGVSCPRSAEMPPDSAPPSSSSGSRSSSSGSSRSVAQSLRLTTLLGRGGQPRPPEIDTRRPRPLQAATMTSTPSEKKLP